jgi:hypothetical protein
MLGIGMTVMLAPGPPSAIRSGVQRICGKPRLSRDRQDTTLNRHVPLRHRRLSFRL